MLNKTKTQLHTGISMIELVLVVTILFVFSLIAVRGLDGFRIIQSHSAAEDAILAVLNEGRTRANAGDYACDYDVQISNLYKTVTISRIILDPNNTPYYTSSLSFDTKTTVSTSLNNTNTDTVTFTKFSGATTNTGTITITTQGFGKIKTSTIAVYASGLASIN
jgi:type II secretory pathway pseudopilin PulG